MPDPYLYKVVSGQQQSCSSCRNWASEKKQDQWLSTANEWCPLLEDVFCPTRGLKKITKIRDGAWNHVDHCEHAILMMSCIAQKEDGRRRSSLTRASLSLLWCSAIYSGNRSLNWGFLTLASSDCWASLLLSLLGVERAPVVISLSYMKDMRPVRMVPMLL